MKLELLKKLTKLANNNPNDNEANLAARKVCKMLEESNFSLSENGYANPKPPNQRPGFSHVANPYNNSWMCDWFRDFNQDDARYRDFREGSWDIPRDKTEEFKKAERDSKNKSETTYVPFDWMKEPVKKKKEKRTLKCTKCNKKQETTFVGLEDVYQCNNCQWTAYTETKI